MEQFFESNRAVSILNRRRYRFTLNHEKIKLNATSYNRRTTLRENDERV